jgi:hypothetical protein
VTSNSAKNNSSLRLLGAIAVVAILMAAAVQLQAIRERVYPPSQSDDLTLYVTSGTAARRLTLAFPALAADLYWIRALQYYGNTKLRLEGDAPVLAPPLMLASDPSVSYPLLYPLLDLTTSLDPWFNVAYRFGAVFLAEPYPRGAGRPDLAVALLEKGLRDQPDKWEYMQDIGFVHYWYSHNYREAASWFGRAGAVPGAPWWLQALAATTLAQGGDRKSSRQMWLAIHESAQVDWLKKDAERRLFQLRALDEIDQLQQRVDTFGRSAGEHPASWQQLVRAGVVPGLPIDPAGTPYELDSDGRVRLSATSPLWPLPEEPEAISRRPSA